MKKESDSATMPAARASVLPREICCRVEEGAARACL